MTIPINRLEQFAAQALQHCGLQGADASQSARLLAMIDSWGVFTHGTKLLRGYVKRLQAGGLRAQGVPRIVSQGPAWAQVDGDSALGMVASTFAMQTAIEKARTVGVCYVGMHNTCHFGAAGTYAYQAATQGLIGLAMANDIPSVTAPGARGPVLGSNPFAFAIPHEPQRPILLDMATSTVAGGKVYAAKAHGQSIPLGWLTDADGRPTTDPRHLTEGGALTPMAGHKGYGIALLIESLAGALTGAAMTWGIRSWSFQDPSQPTHHGAAFLAIAPEVLAGAEPFAERIARLSAELRASPRGPDSQGVLLPGDLEWARRDRAQTEGIELPSDVTEQLLGLANDIGIPFPQK